MSVGDEIGYELVYDHKVHPETLMALPEDQMLAPHIVESRAVPGPAGSTPVTAGDTNSKMVALVIDPAIVGTEQVAPVRPGEIPVFEPPVPAVSGHVPDFKGGSKARSSARVTDRPLRVAGAGHGPKPGRRACALASGAAGARGA